MTSTRYRLVVKGELGARYASAFDEMTICAHDGITDITGAIIDQSHLQGLLEQIARLGLTLHSVSPHAPENREPAAHTIDPSKSNPV